MKKTQFICLINRQLKKSAYEKAVKRENSKLIFENKVFDFGQIEQDTVISAVFIFKNTGKKNLIIDYVNPDCSCTDYYLSKDTISPEDTASIVLFLNAINKLGKVKGYTIVSANTEEELYKLTLKGEVIKNKLKQVYFNTNK
jgi:hypothetical protein